VVPATRPRSRRLDSESPGPRLIQVQRLRVAGTVRPRAAGPGGGPDLDSDASHGEWHKGLHGLAGSGPGYSIVVVSNLAAADPDIDQAPAGGPGPGPAAGASGRAASRAAGAAVRLAGGTASVLALPGPFTSEANNEAENSEPLLHQPLSQSGSPGPPGDDSPEEESGKNFTHIVRPRSIL
jgi:hypothetical protein